MCRKELQRLLPIVVYDERFRTNVFKVIEDIKRVQSDEAQNSAQARQKALGYNETFLSNTNSPSSTFSITIPATPLVVANNIFDRGKKRKTSGPLKGSTRKKKE